MYAPFLQECACGTSCEFRSTVGSAFVWDAKGGEQSSKGGGVGLEWVLVAVKASYE